MSKPASRYVFSFLVPDNGQSACVYVYLNRSTGWHECIRYVMNTYFTDWFIHIFTLLLFIFFQPTTRVGLAPDIAWGVGAIQRDRGGPWDRKQYSSLPHSTPDNTALAARKRHPLGWVSDQKIARQICWKEYFRQTTVEFQRHISNNTCQFCVTVHEAKWDWRGDTLLPVVCRSLSQKRTIRSVGRGVKYAPLVSPVPWV